MPTIPYVRNATWADGSGGGTPISAAKLNVLDNGIYEVSYAPAVRVFHNTTQSISTSTNTAVAFNSERFDQAANASDTMHDTSTNNSRLTCRYAGVYMIGGHLQWASNGTGERNCFIRLNGTTSIGISENILASADSIGRLNLVTLYPLAVNDYVELMAWQTSGAGLNVASSGNVSPEFWMVRVA